MTSPTNLQIKRYQSSVIFTLDIAHLLSLDLKVRGQLQERRATEEFSRKLRKCFSDNTAGLKNWVDERHRISSRMEEADRKGGKKVWTQRFLDRHSSLVLLDGESLLLPDGPVGQGMPMTQANGRFSTARLTAVTYRLAREGVLVATYTADFSGQTHDIHDVIKSLAGFRAASYQTFQTFISDYFKNDTRRRLIAESTGLAMRDPADISDDQLRGITLFHSFVLVEGFAPTSSAPNSITIDNVARSRELAGILNEATWFESYAAQYCQEVGDKQIGYRSDEIYVTDRRTTVVVSERFWTEDDPLVYYRSDLLQVIEHHLTRLALMTQLSEFFGDSSELRPLTVEPADALPLVLAGRDNVTLLHDSLNYGLLVRHGFTRHFAKQLREEMGFPESLALIEKRVSDLSEAISLKSSVTSAKAATQLATRNNRLQATSLAIATLAILVSVLLSIGFAQRASDRSPTAPAPPSLTGTSAPTR